MEQFAPWLSLPFSRAELFMVYHALNQTEPNVFLFAIEGRDVDLIDKPARARHETYHESLKRAVMYRNFLERVVRSHDRTRSILLAIYVGDGALELSNVPVFAFQKPKHDPSPLLPDIDLIDPGFFASERNTDGLAYHDKMCAAVFAGSTTGGQVTVDAINDLSIPRIRAAVFFRDHPAVTFRLPHIVQCASNEAEMLLQGMGFGDGLGLSWAEQTKYRFILCMDGNGPSCARISTGLRSNSVLMQYQSEHLMYYFGGLRPWLHYLPIAKDSDVGALIEYEKTSFGTFDYVARAGRCFAETFLSRDAVIFYMSNLLDLYDKITSRGPQ